MNGVDTTPSLDSDIVWENDWMERFADEHDEIGAMLDRLHADWERAEAKKAAKAAKKARRQARLALRHSLTTEVAADQDALVRQVLPALDGRKAKSAFFARTQGRTKAVETGRKEVTDKGTTTTTVTIEWPAHRNSGYLFVEQTLTWEGPAKERTRKGNGKGEAKAKSGFQPAATAPRAAAATAAASKPKRKRKRNRAKAAQA